ncbi:MAG: alpha/beta hydrolase [Caulobacter sp.]|nr:alpha/beta hydrolase [Caulobacter sp.]
MAADWTRRTLLAATGLAAAAPALAGAPRVIPIWPNGPPGGEGVPVVEEVVERNPPPNPLRDRYVKHVRNPTLTVFAPARPNGASLLMTPGGGYKWVVMDKEGYECAERFAAVGVTVYVASYRLPADGWAAGPAAPLQDAQRALRLVRSLAPDPKRVGVMGFSAGGHVAGCLGLMWDAPTYAPVDAVDGLSARPDLSMLMYPVATMHPAFAHAGSREQLLGVAPTADQERRWSLEDNARPDAPPTFLLHAGDDASVPVENSQRLYDALRAAKVPAEMHLFEEGGHGFGLRFTAGKPVAAWPALVEAWWKRKGFV